MLPSYCLVIQSMCQVNRGWLAGWLAECMITHGNDVASPHAPPCINHSHNSSPELLIIF